jgi:hypothetical protein
MGKFHTEAEPAAPEAEPEAPASAPDAPEPQPEEPAADAPAPEAEPEAAPANADASRTGFAEKGLRAGDACVCPDGRKGTVHRFDAGLICLPNQG